jgi:EAL domain-containing protein (putative c-di-GMP-specific phosphodiesterase class I)
VTTTRISDATGACVHDVIDGDLVRTLFQPIVDLDSGAVVGHEALARGPAGGPLESPLALFAAAKAAGRAAELDWACRAAAYRNAETAGLDRSTALFVNAEPASLSRPCPAHLRHTVEAAEAHLRVVTEMTERAVAADPHALLSAAERSRSVGWGVAMDDVGVDPSSLALLPFVHPDVVKLDLSLIQEPTTRETARVVNAVEAYAERTGALILAEGIETPEHAARARVFGATLGQGFLLGRPASLPAPAARHGRWPGAAHQPVDIAAPAQTPYQIAVAARTPRRAAKRDLLPMSMLLEERVELDSDPMVLLACFQDAEHLTPATARRFQRLAQRATFVAAIGHGLPVEPVPGVRGATLADGDPLRDEWHVIVVGPHFAGALLSRDVGAPTARDMDREFDVVLTHDRGLVLAAARSLMRWVAPVT